MRGEEAATLCTGGCNRRYRRLQPYVSQVRVEEGELAEGYRAVHLARNQAYGQARVVSRIAYLVRPL